MLVLINTWVNPMCLKRFCWYKRGRNLAIGTEPSVVSMCNLSWDLSQFLGCAEGRAAESGNVLFAYRLLSLGVLEGTRRPYPPRGSAQVSIFFKYDMLCNHLILRGLVSPLFEMKVFPCGRIFILSLCGDHNMWHSRQLFCSELKNTKHFL